MLIKDAFERNKVKSNNPYTAATVDMFRDGESTWLWFGDTNIFLPDRAKLYTLFPEAEAVIKAWEYTEEGSRYTLPAPVIIEWRQKTSKESGRPYKWPTSTRKAGETSDEALENLKSLISDGTMFDDDAPAPEQHEFSPETKLRDMAESLGKADAAYNEAIEALNKAEAKFKAENEALYKSVAEAKTERQKLYDEAVEQMRVLNKSTGATGHILGGMFSINRKTVEPLLTLRGSSTMEDLVSWIMYNGGFLSHYLTVDMDGLHKALNGEIPQILQGMPVEYIEPEPEIQPVVRWSQLGVKEEDPLPF